jgi:hypothetical protein
MAVGPYRADWFLRFVGLESFPAYREGGRLQNYRGAPPLSEGAFRALQGLVKDAAENLGRLDSDPAYQPGRDTEDLAGTLLALTGFRLEELAVPEAPGRILRAVRREREKLRRAG